jgi:tripeptide aminopeptidase
MAIATRVRPDIDRREALKLVTEMMAIPGKSREEGRVADFICRRLREAGVPRSQIVVDAANKQGLAAGGEVGNLIVKLPGTERGTRRLLMAHMDTVPLCVGSRPVRKDGFIVARDADTALGADDRAGCGVVLNAVLQIRRLKLPHPPLTLFWPIQEEIGLLGARHVSLGLLGRPKLCFNWDGGAANIATVGATGAYNIAIDVEGIASHAGAHPERGVSATAIAALATADLVEQGWHGLIAKGAKTGTSNIGVVAGGEATNVVMPRLVIHAEARSHDPKFREAIRDAFRDAFERAADRVANEAGQKGRIRFDADLKYEAFRLAEDEPCVRAALSAIRSVGLDPETRVSNGGLDANWMTARGLPTVTLGCGQVDVHTVDESLHIPSYLAACRVALMLATAAE